MRSTANSRARARLAGAALLLALALPAEAFELRAWPLGEIQQSAGSVHTRLLGPLIDWQSDGEHSTLALRPLLTYSSDASRGWSSGSLLYPLASWTRSAEELSIRFFGVGSYVSRRSPPPDRPYASELTIFPLLFYRSGAGGSSLSLLPLYANLENVLGYQRVRMALFPLYLRLEEPMWRRTWLPFPFFSKVGGPSGEGTRLWPAYGHTRLGSQYEARYVGWPFYIRAVAHPGRPDQVTTRISWPLFATIDSPTLESRSYAFLLVLPLYTRTIDRATNSAIEGFPWPFWTTQTDLSTGERRATRYTPIYERRTTATMTSIFYFWPFYRRREGRGDDAGYRRTDVLFVLYRDQLEGDGRQRSRTRALVPLWISRDGPDAGDAQALTLLDGVFPKNKMLRTSWAPLYRLYGAERSGNDTSQDVLWRMWVWGTGKLRPPWYWSRN